MDRLTDGAENRPGTALPAGGQLQADIPGGTEHPPDGAARFQLRLYVAGQTPKSVRAIENLRQVCEEHLAGSYTIELIDLIESPHLARGDEIIAVPTLVRKLPPPIRKIIGDLSDTEQVLVGLQLRGGAPQP